MSTQNRLKRAHWLEKVLLVSDLHLVDNPQESYRFELFPWLLDKVRQYDYPAVLILGDLTDHKDRHPASLVKKIINSITLLSEETNVVILAGNHDCIDPANHFFSSIFANIEGVSFIIEPTLIGTDLFLPHSRNPIADWEDISFDGVDRVFMHQTMNQSVVSNGTKIDGLPASVFRSCSAAIYSGDVHVPQKVGKVTYIGSPYHIHFGDKFKSRVLFLSSDNQQYNLRFNTISKHTLKIRNVDQLNFDSGILKKGDQVKVILTLPRSEFVDWESKRAEVYDRCDELGLVVFGVEVEEYKRKRLDSPDINFERLSATSKEILHKFCEKEKLSKAIRSMGEQFLDEV